jgi:hypothetical protein
MYFTHTQAKDRIISIFEQAGLEPLDAKMLLRDMVKTPLFRIGSREISLYDQIYENVVSGRPWFYGLHKISSRERMYKSDPGSQKRCYWDGVRLRKVLTKINNLMEEEGSMEQQIRRKMSYLVYRIKKGYERQKTAPDRAEQLALDFVVKSNLKTIATRLTLLGAINRIVTKSGGMGFTEDEMGYLEGMPPLLAKETLIVGAYLSNWEVKPKGEKAPATDTTEITSSPEEDEEDYNTAKFAEKGN